MDITSTTSGVTDGSTTNDAIIELNFTSSKATTNFGSDDITVSGGTLTDFASTSSTVYIATFTPSGSGATTIDVSGSAFTDAAGNSNLAATQFNWTYDNVSPSMTITAKKPDNITPVLNDLTTNDPNLLLTFTSSAATNDFIATDISVTNGSIGALSGSGTTYTATFTPLTNGECSIRVLQEKYTDAAGNGNAATPQFTWTYDTIKPTMTITSTTSGVTDGSTTNHANIALLFTSSEATTDFGSDDITVSGGTIGTLSGSGTTYSATFTPTAAGPTTIDVSGSKFTDRCGQ